MPQISTMAEVTLTQGMSAVFEAIDPTTGATVTGVTISNAAIYADTPDELGANGGYDDVIPGLTPTDINEQSSTVESDA